MSATNVVGTCSRCGGPVVVRHEQRPACSHCEAVVKANYGPVIETELPPSKPQLLNEST